MNVTRTNLLIVWAALLVISVAANAAEQAADPYAAALGYKFDQPRTAIMAIEAEIRAAKPAELAAIEAKLLKILGSPDATRDAKDWACRQLRQAGSERSVAALAPLLVDKDLATVARLALQSIPGAKADAALRDAIGAVEGDLKVGVIHSIAARKDREALPLLMQLAGGKDRNVAEAAIYALGQFGGDAAVAALENAKEPSLKRLREHAFLRCADRMAAEGKASEAATLSAVVLQSSDDAVVQSIAIRTVVATGKSHARQYAMLGLESKIGKVRLAAAKAVCELGGGELVASILPQLVSLPADTQVTILSLVSDKAVLPAALEAVKSSDEGIRVAALDAIGRLGDASALPLLLPIAVAGTGDTQAAARKSLERLRAADVDPALIAAAQQGDVAVRAEAIRVVAARGTAAAVPMLLKSAADADPRVQAESVAALGALVDAAALPGLVKLLLTAGEGSRAEVEKAVVAACRRIEDKEAVSASVVAALPQADSAVRVALHRVLGRIPAQKSLAALRAAVSDSDAAVSDASIRGLANWPDAAVLPDLAAIAKSATKPAHQVLAIRGLVRLAALPSDRPAEQTVKLLGETMALTARPDEKKMVLAALGDVKHATALDLAMASLSDPELEVEAATAVIKIARHVRATNPDRAGAAVQKILDTCKTPAARQAAEGSLFVVGNMVNIAPKGTATSPDDLKKDNTAGDDQAAIDDNVETYWDEEDGAAEYRLVVTFKQPEPIAAISIVGYQQHGFAPKDFEILCDGKSVKKVENAQYADNLLIVRLDETTCSQVELKITGYYGKSPAIRELGIYRPIKK